MSEKFNIDISLSYDPETRELIDNSTGALIRQYGNNDDITIDDINTYLKDKASASLKLYKYNRDFTNITNITDKQKKDPMYIINNYYGKPKSWAPNNKKTLQKVIQQALRIGLVKNYKVVDLNFIDTSNITDMSFLFSPKSLYNTNLLSVDVSQWDTSNVTNMRCMFYEAYRIRNLNISNWDVSNVEDMAFMFERSNFSGDISEWDVSNVKDMEGMFSNTTFNEDISSWDVSNVTNMSKMFLDAHYFNQDISNWDVSNVTDMEWMFYNAYKFNQDISNWNVSNVTNMNRMFSDARAFDQDISNWDVSNVETMDNIFRDNYNNNSIVNRLKKNGKLPTWYNENYEESTSYKSRVLNKISERSQFSKDLKKLMNN